MNQTAPDDPSTKPYADLVKIAKDYYDVTKNTLTERQEFRARQQRPGEGTSDYILARTCVHPHVSCPLYHCAMDAEHLKDCQDIVIMEIS